MSIESYLRAAPKAELHVHLEGAIRPETLLTLARRNKVDLPAVDVEGLGRWFDYRDFDHFLQIYVAITRCLRTREDYELIVTGMNLPDQVNDVPITRIGQIIDSSPDDQIWLVTEAGETLLEPAGWQHFV